jgi:adenylate kinase
VDAENLRQILASGKLVSTDIVNKFALKAVDNIQRESKHNKGIVFDGYPRNLIQAEYLNNKFPDEEFKVIFFDITFDNLVARVTGRFTCKECGAIYNKKLMMPKTDGECDMCSSKEFVTREDDNLESLKTRWKEYQEQTMPLVAYYNAKGALIKIDATKTREEITYQIVAELKKH